MPPFDPASSPDPDAGVLHKVRSLLAKAESTTFPDEAEALTAKAQELMDRHSIDRAVLGVLGRAHEPEGRRVRIENPYVRPKFQLLSEVADANRCRAVLSVDTQIATVVGFPDDQETVEVLYTSLLLQATSAMLRDSAAAGRRVKAFRHAFLLAFASRIGVRLRSAAAAVLAEAERDHGGSVLPVLAGRADAVDRAVEAEFPYLRTMRTSVSDRRGVAAGHAAADRVALGTEVGRRRPRRGLPGH